MRKASLLAVLLLAAACAPLVKPPAVSEPPRAPAAFPEEFYRQAGERGEPVFRIDPQRSQAVIHVYRGGPLARFGHDHAIASRRLHGYILLPRRLDAAQADLYVPLESLSVDDPALRAQAGFDTTVSAADIAGTRRNMLEKVLEAERYPFAVLHLSRPEGELPALILNAEIGLHGVTQTLRLPVEIEPAAGELRAHGRFSLRQTEFGITPYSLLGGALQVQDRIDLEFEVRARRL
ncbi:MAG: hypothetical protein A2151_03980 [Candidatus Muproteobacteria bacterium RBG_16_65_34]|uniref:Lipid/polyisoprenoid-binding YceI-like domain-containing protein n=1 Tax=Candidatus Muproteobacteria bacterium RBG_16_65_34 TaxID=1817760 RepID=A0A1F6TTA0_9PROT|nr:MAG: hypothetical protein A2151_03980 [Candidatus Muproteobacteria bacterium RBG_16_65_34]